MLWDLTNQSIEDTIQASELSAGDPDAECTVVKRDPHEAKLISAGLEEDVAIVDLRKRPGSLGADMRFKAHTD